jgi:uncharacterized protein (TIGR02145 family)
MRHILSIAIIALVFWACGEVGGNENNGEPTDLSSGSGTPSSGSGGNSSGSTGTDVCTGPTCCNGAPFDASKNFCQDNQLYPLCDGKTYNTSEQGCFEGKLYPKCSIERTRGTCVHDKLLRCKQEGSGEDKIIRPQPGMTCELNGKITGITIDLADMKQYKIVQIGGQMWLAENVKRTPFPYSNEHECYGGDAANCDAHGYLYDWATMMGLPDECNGTNDGCPQRKGNGLWPGLCPSGFGVPKKSDWEQLIAYAGGGDVAGGRLKSASGWSNNGNGTDSYGFNALPGGFKIITMPDIFYYLSSGTMWWHDEPLESEAYRTVIIASDTEAKINFQQKGHYMGPLRCVHYF